MRTVINIQFGFTTFEPSIDAVLLTSLNWLNNQFTVLLRSCAYRRGNLKSSSAFPNIAPVLRASANTMSVTDHTLGQFINVRRILWCRHSLGKKCEACAAG